MEGAIINKIVARTGRIRECKQIYTIIVNADMKSLKEHQNKAELFKDKNIRNHTMPMAPFLRPKSIN